MAGERGYYNVRLTLKDRHTVDEFFKYRGEDLPRAGEIIEVVRFMRDQRRIRARVTFVHGGLNPRITAIQVD